MDLDIREQVRISLLRYLARAAEHGLGQTVLWTFVRTEGFTTVSRQDIGTELQYLTDKGLVASLAKDISPELAHWRITATGRDWLAKNLE
jgi:DNA-binding PadR family transcriptional regulator